MEDVERIGDILEAEQFSFLKEEILEQWFETANESQYQNLKQYADESNDEEVLKHIEEGVALLELEDNAVNSADDQLNSSSSKPEHCATLLFSSSARLGNGQNLELNTSSLYKSWPNLAKKFQ